MPKVTAHSISKLLRAIVEFSNRHPESLCHFRKGERIFTQGQTAEDCFMIKNGVVSVLVHEEEERIETEIALRFEGDLVGESAILHKNANRTASVEVVSRHATLIRLTAGDLFTLLRDAPEVHSTLNLLWAMESARKAEALQVVQGKISVTHQIMSALIADIHNFTGLGEAVGEEHVNAFLFDFIEKAQEMAHMHHALFEDQGDGFKVVFSGSRHALEGAAYALSCARLFEMLRSAWCQVDAGFSMAGLGMGLCSDFMSIHRRQGAPRNCGRVLSHTINVAAALANCRARSCDIDVWLNDNARTLLCSQGFEISGPRERSFKKLGRRIPIFQLKSAANHMDCLLEDPALPVACRKTES